MSSPLLLTSIQEVSSTNDLIPLLKDFRNSDNANLRTAEARDALLSVTRLVTSPEAVFWFGKCFSWFATPPEGQELCASAAAPSAANSVTAQQQQQNTTASLPAASITPNNNLPSLADAFIFAARAATTPESVRMLTIAINNICCNERAREKFFANRPELRDAFLLMARPASATVSATDVWSRAVNQICNDSINGKTLFAVPQFASIMMDPIARKGLSLSQPPAAGSPAEAFAAVHSAVQHWSEVLQSLLSGKNYPGTVFDSFATPELWRTIQEVAEKLLRPSDPRQASVFVESFRPHFERALVSVVHHSPELTQAFLEAGLSPNVEGPRGGKLIHQACGGGRIPIIKLLLTFGASIHDVNEEKNTPLHQACSSGNSDLVQFLLENGASADAKNSLKETPLDVAKRCQRRQAQKVMEDFFKAGNAVFGNNNNNSNNNDNDAHLKNKNALPAPPPPPPPSQTTTTIMTGGHPIVISHSLPGITFGNNNHTGINNNHLQQPQFQVYHDDDKEVTEYLKLDHSNLGGGGGGSNSNGSSHHDPIYEQNGGDASLAARQMKLFDLVSKGKTRLFAKLDATRSFGPIRVDEELKDKSQMMHVATQWEQLEFAELLLKKGASVACKDAAGQQPLHRCAAWNRVDGSEWLLRNGAQVNALDAHGRSPLMYSALYGHAKVTQYLLQHGANKDLRDHNGKNARSLAEERQNKKVVRLLDGLPVTIDNNTVTFDPVKNVVTVTSGIQSQYSSSPMPSISIGGIITSGGTPGSNGSATLSPPNQGIVVGPNNSSVLPNNNNNNSALPNNANTSTPTHITGVGTILTNEKYTHNQMLLGRKIVKLANNGYHEVLRETVLHQGADVNFRDPENGRTALHSACAAGNFLNTRVLLECGADVNIRNGDGETARDLAMRTQRKRVLEVFDEFAPLDSFAIQQQNQLQHQRRIAGGGAAASSTLTGISSQQQQLQPILTNQIPLGSILLGSGLPLHQQQHVLLHHHHHHHHHMASPVLVQNPFNSNNSSHLAPVFIDPSLNNIHHHHHHHFNNHNPNNRVGAPGGIIFGAAGGNGTTANALPLSPSSSSSSPAAGTAELEATVRFLREQNETLLRNNRNLENDTATLKQENEGLKKKLEEIKRMFNF